MEHLTFDEYLASLRGQKSFEDLARSSHEHLVSVCRACEAEWKAAHSRNDPPPFSAGRHEPFDLRSASLADLERAEALLSASREAARLAREDLSLLLRMPADERLGRVTRARTRMRSRAFAELLVEEARERLDEAPEEAVELAGLVRPVLDRGEERMAQGWARELVAAAEACRDEARRRLADGS